MKCAVVTPVGPGHEAAVRFDPATVPVHPLDALVRERVDFVKIDVEWMEMEVLAGAKKLIAASRPAFAHWLAANDHAVVDEFVYVNARNDIVAPRPAGSAADAA